MAAIDNIAEIGKLMRRKRIKSKRVLSGTMRRRRKEILSYQFFSRRIMR
jgi:hypothetical protein